MTKLLVSLAALAVLLGALPAHADWDPTDPYKWVQSPDLTPTGIDVNASEPFILADDFLCETTGLITDIHIWGSWRYDEFPMGDPGNVMFVLSIHSDIPDTASPTGYSMPGDMLWFHAFPPGTFQYRWWVVDLVEGWMDPPEGYIFPGDTQCWQYNFIVPDSLAFEQFGTPEFPQVYWLDVQAYPADTAYAFGWKTSLDHWNDDAVYGQGAEPYSGSWSELRYPPGHEMYQQSIDLAFVITTEETQDPADWGDAPNSSMGYNYPTVAAENGANHASSQLYMGPSIDYEPNGQPDAHAVGDDNNNLADEDGVIFTSLLVPGLNTTVDVIVNGAPSGAYVDAWVDFDADGGWAEANDQIFSSQYVTNGTNSLSFPVPASAAGGSMTFTRFRLSYTGGLPFTGPAPAGEVEDYEVPIEFEEEWKWEQHPDLDPTGIDINATEPYILADDFECTETGIIDEISVWGSWLGDVLPYVDDPTAVTFILSLHEDIPDTLSPTGYSMPGNLLWWKAFDYPDFQVALYQQNLEEGWMDPPNMYVFPGDTQCWLYTFGIPDSEHVYQVGTPDEPKVYWLNVQARPHDIDAIFGWKTSLEHWNDDGVWGSGIEPYEDPWEELIYPLGHQFEGESIDLAFVIHGSPATDVPDGEIPREFGLGRNVPNPFNPATTIAYEIPAGGAEIRLEIVDVAGRHVRTLVDGFATEGSQRVTWNGLDDEGRKLPSGVYFYRLVGAEVEEMQKMLLLK
jgi:hypothetical protein